jgi:hypothetical protein
MEAGGLCEGAEVAVSRNEGNGGVDTGLGDEGIAEAGFAAFRQDLGAESSGSLPKTRFDLEQWHIREVGGKDGRKF